MTETVTLFFELPLNRASDTLISVDLLLCSGMFSAELSRECSLRDIVIMR